MLKKNDKYFKNITNLECCYWAGFIAADGNIFSPSSKLSIELSLKDLKHLEKFIKAIEWQGKIRFRKRNFKIMPQGPCDITSEFCRVQIHSSQEFIFDLKQNFNITDKKTHTLLPPSLPYISELAFLSGYLDGDGSVGLDKKANHSYTRVTFSCKSIYMRDWIKNIIFQITLKYPHINGINIISTGAAADRLLDELLSIDIPRLERKWNIRGNNALHKGRKSMKGKNNPNFKINNYKEIYDLYISGMTQKEIADKFEIHQTSISRIIRFMKAKDDYVDTEEAS